MLDGCSKYLLGSAIVLIAVLGLTPSAQANVKISSVGDINMGTYSGSGHIEGQDGICIYNDATDDYAITITATGGSYLLHSGLNTMPVEIYFRGASGSYRQHEYGIAEGYTGADRLSTSCSGGTNATLKVRVTEPYLLSVRPGIYSTTLTILLETN